MIPSIVEHQDHAPARCVLAQQPLEKAQERRGVECRAPGPCGTMPVSVATVSSASSSISVGSWPFSPSPRRRSRCRRSSGRTRGHAPPPPVPARPCPWARRRCRRPVRSRDLSLSRWLLSLQDNSVRVVEEDCLSAGMVLDIASVVPTGGSSGVRGPRWALLGG